jgi:hypothetical protein
MMTSKELEKLLTFDMPKRSIPRSTSTQTPDFATKCHYTLRIYACTHKSFLPTPRITHVSPCLYAVPSSTSPILNDLSAHQLLTASNKRCDNLASAPKELYLDEVCSKCQPHPRGTEKKLRNLETLTNTEQTATTTEDLDGSADEIERGLQALTLNSTPSTSQPATKPTLKLETENINNIAAIEPLIEQPTDSEVSTPPDMQPKKERWVDVCPSVPNGVAPGASVANKGLLSKIFSPFGRSDGVSTAEKTAEHRPVEEAKVERENGVGVAKTGKKKSAWIKVKEDPDWEVVTDEERKDKVSWKDEGEWVNVDR